MRKPVDCDGNHSEAVLEQEADQQEELQAEPGLESKGTKDHLKRSEQKLDLILDRISNAEENLGQRISPVEENLNERIARAIERIEKLEGTVDHIEGKLHVQDMMISDLKEALQGKNETSRKLEDEVDDIQGRIRRKTLIFRGVSEGAEGFWGWLSCKRYIEKNTY